jgi:polar amino acid transport system ATP-binding protein
VRELREIRLRCGFVFQQFHLFPHLTVLHNLLLAPTRVKNLSRLAAEEIATNLLNQVGLENKATQRPGTLSGGEQQRVAIARALAMQPAYLLYDEPTSSLDRDRAREIWKIMRNLAQGGQTQIIVTHQEELVKEVPCRVLGMRDGKIEQIST